MEFTTLKNGVRMPLEGFGVFQVPDAALCEQSVTYALSAGYRLIDTEPPISMRRPWGAAIRKSGIPREELFITTKLWIQDQGYAHAKQAFEASMENGSGLRSST